MSDRKWLPTIADLIDRLSIHQLKEVFIIEAKEKYASEIAYIVHDLDMLISEQNVKVSARLIRAIVVLSQINTHIWHNESEARKGNDISDNNLMLSHGLNGIRHRMINIILEEIGMEEKKDIKIDCLASEFKEWDISLI